MKTFAACILALTLVVTGIFGPVPACANGEPYPSPTPWMEYGDLLDKQVYSTDHTVLQVVLSGYFNTWSGDTVSVEISRQGAGGLVFYRETREMAFQIDIGLQPGEYLLRAYNEANEIYTPFSVVGESDLFLLTTEAVSERWGDEDYLIGVKLAWDGPVDGGPYTLTRIDSWGGVKVFENIEQSQFFDAETLPGGINTYTVSDGKRVSSPAVIDLRGFPPLEYAGNQNDRVIVMKIGDPYMYAAEDKQSAMQGKGLTRLGPIYWDDLGVVPRLMNDRTMVPIAALVRQMGGMVGWNGRKQIVTIRYDGNALEIPIGSRTVYLNGQKRSFDTPARIDRDRTLVPVRHLELLNCEVNWVGKSRSIVICYRGI